MLRNLTLAFCATAFILSGCGRQVTPNRPGTDGVGLQPGFMQVKFTTAGPLDFVDYQYIIAFNTSSTPGMPYARNGNQAQNWTNFSFEIVVGGTGQAVTARVYQFVTQTANGGVKQPYLLQPTPQILQPVNINCNGQGTQFCVTFDRTLFNGISVAPKPGSSPAPTPSPQSNQWFVNWFAADQFGNPVDAPGLAGPQDTSFVFGPLNVQTSFDRQWTAQAGWPQVAPPAQIVGGEVINNP